MAERPILDHAEAILAGILLTLMLTWPVVALLRGVDINVWISVVAMFFQVGLVIFGLYLRFRLKLEPFAKMAIAIGFLFSTINSISVLVELRLPTETLWLDPVLMGVDESLGYSWVGLMSWLAENPILGDILGFVYRTSIPQIAILIILLALMRRYGALDRMLLTGVFSLVITVSIWLIAPSFGPGFSLVLPDRVTEAMDVVVNEPYRLTMQRLVESGPDSVPPLQPLGLVAFPSYHTVMALLVVVFARGTFVFLPVVGFNLLMLPAVLAQGAHYISDMAGGLAVFLFAAYLARLIRPGETGADFVGVSVTPR